MVVRGRVELPTFRFSEGLSSTREPPRDAAVQPIYQHMGVSGACGSSLAGVPTCAGECRLVRVIRVLDPPRPGLVLLLCWPQQPRSAVATAPGPSVPAGRRPGAAGPGMTYRDERNVRRRIKPPISPNIRFSTVQHAQRHVSADPPILRVIVYRISTACSICSLRWWRRCGISMDSWHLSSGICHHVDSAGSQERLTDRQGRAAAHVELPDVVKLLAVRQRSPPRSRSGPAGTTT